MQLTDIVDMVASLGLIMVLGYAYAQLHHRLRFPKASQIVLGALFGLAAALQMVRPFEPMDGLIIDFRNIPIAMAGAFLGIRGALTCLAIAVAMRLNLGGVGMWGGVLGMVLALAGGAFWAGCMRFTPKRGLGAMVFLALATSSHLGGALVMPEAARDWFIEKAALPLLMVNIFAVPIVGSILEAERFRHRDKRRLHASAVLDPDTGLPHFESFTRQCMIRAVAMDDGSYTQILVLRLRHYQVLTNWGRAALRKQLLAAMKLRVETVLPKLGLASCYEDRLLLIPLTLEDLSRREELLVEIRRAVTEAPYVHGNTKHRQNVDMHVVPLETETEFAAALDRIAKGSNKVVAQKQQRGIVNRQVQEMPVAKGYKSSTDKMFAKLEVLLKQNKVSGRSG
ncbi:MAG: LytS/YhcK type 5TM receptor domain-containing protein [Pseudomonadota bacterium]